MYDVGRAAAEYGVVFVLALRGEAFGAALLKTDGLFETVVPAARALAEVSADGSEVSYLRRGDGVRGFGESGEASAHFGVLFELRERDERADAKTFVSVALDAVEAAYAFEVNHARGARDVVLHSRQQILPARKGSRRVVHLFRRGRGLQETHGLAYARRTRPLERLHTLCPPFVRPVRILSGVTGSSPTRTPHA